MMKYQRQNIIEIYYRHYINKLLKDIMEPPSFDDAIKGLPIGQKVAVAALRELQIQREKIDEQQQVSIRAISKKYEKLKQPLLDRVSEIIQGGSLNKEELEGLEKLIKKNQNLPTPLPNSTEYKGKKISQFWPSVITNSSINKYLNENDQKALTYLLNIKRMPSDQNQTQPGVQCISLNFIFKANSYFQQTNIVRTLKINQAQNQVLCIQGTPVKLKQLGNSLLYDMKKVTNKKTGQSKVTQGKKKQSLFDIFFDQNQTNLNDLSRCNIIMNDLSTIIENSVEYFLGVVEVDDEDDQYDDQQEQQEIEEDQQPQIEDKTKKRKKN